MTLPIRALGPRIAASLKGLPLRDRVAAATGLSPETVGAVESFAMGATDPIKALGRKGIEAWHRGVKGLKSFDDLEGDSFYNPKREFFTNREQAEMPHNWGRDAGQFTELPKEETSLYRVMLDTDQDHLLRTDWPQKEQSSVVRQVLAKYGVPEDSRFPAGDLSKAVRRDVNESASEFLPRVDRNMLTNRRIANEGIDGIAQRGTTYGDDLRIGMTNPRRIKILERLAAAGFSTEAIRALMERVQSQPRDRQKTGGW